MLYILAILFPPLAVACTNKGGAFLLNLFLCFACLWVGGIVHALLVVNDYYKEKRDAKREQLRYDAILKAAQGGGK